MNSYSVEIEIISLEWSPHTQFYKILEESKPESLHYSFPSYIALRGTDHEVPL